MGQPDGGQHRDGILGGAPTFVALAGGVVALVVAITQDRPASAIGLALVVLIACVGATARALSRTETGARRYRAGPPAVAIGWTLLIGGAVAIGSIPSAQHWFVHAALGFRSVKEGIALQSVRVLEKPRAYAIAVSVDNETKKEQLATSITVTVSSEYKPHGSTVECLASPYQLRVSPTLRVVDSQAGRERLSGSVVQSGGKGFKEPASGSVNGYCADQTLTLTMPTAIHLVAGKHSDVLLEVPRRLRVTKDVSPRSPAHSYPRFDPIKVIDVGLPHDHQRESAERQIAGRIIIELQLAGVSGSVWACYAAKMPWLEVPGPSCRGVRPSSSRSQG